MAVRVKVRLHSLHIKKEVESIALLNSGFETESPEILLPTHVAEELGLWPNLPQTIVKTFESPTGISRMLYLPDAIKVTILAEDRTSKTITCNLVISEYEREPLISDKAIGALEVVIVNAGEGLWKFIDSPTTYKSEA